MLSTLELLKLFILVATLNNAAPHKPTDFDEFKAFLDVPCEEAEEPCEIAIESANPLLRSWYARHCEDSID